jgi:hypothetical protein
VDPVTIKSVLNKMLIPHSEEPSHRRVCVYLVWKNLKGSEDGAYYSELQGSLDFSFPLEF